MELPKNVRCLVFYQVKTLIFFLNGWNYRKVLTGPKQPRHGRLLCLRVGARVAAESGNDEQVGSRSGECPWLEKQSNAWVFFSLASLQT